MALSSNIKILIFALCLSLLSLAATQSQPPYTPTDFILLDCGASSNGSLSLDERIWTSDLHSKFMPSNSNASAAYQASQQDSSVPFVPYMTARIFHSKFAYSFPLSSGPKFIRLHFYPATYSSLNTSTSFFTVTANSYTLLSNFSAYLTVSALSPQVAHFTKEFIVTVWDKQVLSLAFSPSANSFAFINGIEIVSIPDNLYTTNIAIPYPFVGSDTLFDFDNTTSLETVYRVNVGGGLIGSRNDSGMFRTWHDDSSYIFGPGVGVVHRSRNDLIKYTKEVPAYVAPSLVYLTKRTMGKDPNLNLNYNLTWQFSVDPGFNYLFRLHFCETEEEVTETNQRVFFVFINNMTAEADADVINWAGGSHFPTYKDYIVEITPESQKKQDLWLALHPNTISHPQYHDAILNGIEIFKLNKSDGSLAGPNPELNDLQIQPKVQPNLLRNRNSKRLTCVFVGAMIGASLFCVFISYFFVYQRNGNVKNSCPEEQKSFGVPFWYTYSSGSVINPSLPTDLCCRFSITELKAATRNFDDGNVIGSGGFGKVYYGYLAHTSIRVAIKRLDSSSKQGTREFKNEIEMLSKLRHVNLVSLIGYCNDEGEMILVYDYMINGTLRDHLYETNNDPLSWKQRLEICIGAARGLHYLHSGLRNVIIHRDVKTTNILLDENLVAKVSDFGLSRIGLNNDGVSTVVKGTWGYLDPEYARFQQLTEKSDVYSFGVVLLEVLCARKAVNQKLEEEQMNLVNWAKKCIQKGTIDQIIDPYLKYKIAPECFKKFVEIAESCVRNQGFERPIMNDVMGELEFALELQETADAEMMAMNPGRDYVYPQVSYHAIAPTFANINAHDLDADSTSRFTTWITDSNGVHSAIEREELELKT